MITGNSIESIKKIEKPEIKKDLSHSKVSRVVLEKGYFVLKDNWSDGKRVGGKKTHKGSNDNRKAWEALRQALNTYYQVSMKNLAQQNGLKINMNKRLAPDFFKQIVQLAESDQKKQ